MSKYVRKDLFAKFKEQVQQDSSSNTGQRGPSNKWPNPPVGEYKFRFLPDKSGMNFYKKYYYHMYQVGDKWTFSICPKTFDFECFCPLCAAAARLYKTGNESDKREASIWKRKEKFVANIYVVADPRDVDKDDEMKQVGKVKLFEFGTKLESQIRVSILDEDDGVGPAGFDPSKEGINFTLRVTETTAGPDGKKWLNYDTSSFARNPSALVDSDEEIDKIMDNTFDLDEYLKGMKVNEEDVIEVLKEEQLYPLIQEDYERVLKKRGVPVSAPTPKEPAKSASKAEEKVDAPKPEPKAAETPTPNSEDSELLSELANL